MLQFPKPGKKKKPDRDMSAFRATILGLDDYKCQNIYCLFLSNKGVMNILDPHHIFPRGRGGDESPENGITLCRYCHDAVEGRRSILIGNQKIRGRRLMKMILEALEHKPNFRFRVALDKLRESE
jgi:predicted restriction endonuclease